MNLKLNKQMFHGILEPIKKNSKLNSELLKIAASNFIEINDCWFLNSLLNKQLHIKSSEFIDKTGYECFVNSLHIDDFVKKNFLSQAILFIGEIIENWVNLNNHKSLEIILSETDFGISIKFHLVRENEEWIAINDVEKFTEGIMIIRVLSILQPPIFKPS
jgi:hypothetical protein